MIRTLNKMLAVLLAMLMLMGALPLQALAAEEEPRLVVDAEGNVISPELAADNPDPESVTWEEAYEYGAFAFGNFQADLHEGEPEGLDFMMLPVYRLGGGTGRAEVTIRYTPAVSRIYDDCYTYDYAASALDDVRLEAEDTDPAAQYQALAVPRVTPLDEAPVLQDSGDEEFPLALTVPDVEAVKWQWELSEPGSGVWEALVAQKEEKLLLTAEDLEAYDFRLVYETEEGWFGTCSWWGEAYIPYAEELPELPEEGLSFDYEPDYLPITVENPFDEVEFTLTFAENELVKYIRVTVLDDDLPELQEMGMLTMMSNRGADIETDYCTMTVVVKDDEDKLPSEVGFTVTSVEVDQDKSTAELTVRRTGGTNYVLTVPWETMDNTARAGKQYSPSSGELVFLGDLTEQTIEIPLIAEAERSEALSFYVVLGGVRGGGEDHLAALGEATAEVKLTSAGKVFQLEDGLNLASVLARGESSSVQARVYEADPMIGAPTAVTAAQEAPEAASRGTAEFQGATAADGSDASLMLWEQRDYYTFSRGDDYKGWRDWEKVSAHTWIKNDQEIHYGAKPYFSEGGPLAGVDMDNTMNYQDQMCPADNYEDGQERTNIFMLFAGSDGKSLDLTIKNGGYLFDQMVLYQYDRSGYDDNYPHGGTFSLTLGEGREFKNVKTDWYYHYYSSNKDTLDKVTDILSSPKKSDMGMLSLNFGGNFRYAASIKLSQYNLGLEVRELALRRRVFSDSKLDLKLYTANDSNELDALIFTEMGNTENQDAVSRFYHLEEDNELYGLIAPEVTIESGGVTKDGELYVGTKLKISVPTNIDSYVVTDVDLASADQVSDYRVKKATKNGDGTWSVELLWDGMTLEDLDRHYSLVIVLERRQELVLDLNPSLPLDGDSNPLVDIDSALTVFTEEFAKDMEYIFCSWDGVAGPRRDDMLRFNKGLLCSDFKSTSSGSWKQYVSGRLKDGAVTFSTTDLQAVNFHQDHDDVILHNGKAYDGDATIYLTRADLNSKRLVFYFYDSSVKKRSNKMKTSILSAGLYYDANGNGRIDGCFDDEEDGTGLFLLDPEAAGGPDEMIRYVGDEEIDEAMFYPVVDEDGTVHQYFLKTTYSMMPRNLIPDTASGASMEDTVRVLPAFISAVTSDSSQGALTAEQDAYRYLQAGFGRYATTKKDASGEIPYFDTSTGQLMYGAEASATRMVDIPLGGDMNPCHKDGSGTWVWEPDFKGSLLFDFEHPEPIKNDGKNMTGMAVEYAQDQFTRGTDGFYVYAGDGAAKLNAYLGSFYGNSTYAVCVNEKTELASRGDINPETISIGTIRTIPNSDYLSLMKGEKNKKANSNTNGKSDFPEFEFDMGVELPSLEFGLSDYAKVVMDGKSVGFTIGMPLNGYEHTAGSTPEKKGWHDSNSGIVDQAKGVKAIHDFIHNVGDAAGNNKSKKDKYNKWKNDLAGTSSQTSSSSQSGTPSQPRPSSQPSTPSQPANPNQPGNQTGVNNKMQTRTFSASFSVMLAFMFEYNPIDDGFYFQSAGIAAHLELQGRLQARLTPCPIFYAYMVFGVEIELGTGIGVARVVDEGAPIPVASMNNKVIDSSHTKYLAKDETISFNMRFSDDLRGMYLALTGKVYMEVKDSEGNLVKSGQFASGGTEDKQHEVLFPEDYADKGTLTFTIKAISATTISKLTAIKGAKTVPYWKGINLSIAPSLEVGVGAGVEILKVELYAKIAIALGLTFGSYDVESDSYGPVNMDNFDLSMALGINITALFFNFSMDVVGFYLHGEMTDPWKGTTEWSWHVGVVNDSIPVTDEKKSVTLQGMEEEGFGFSQPVSYAATQHFVRARTGSEAELMSYDPNDALVPFQLSGYGASGDAFKLMDGLGAGYSYKVFAANGETYILYPISVQASNPLDYSQLVMSKVVVTGLSTGLQNPLDPQADAPYIVVDALEGAANTGDLEYDVSVDGSTVTVAFTSYEQPASAERLMSAQEASGTLVTKRAVIDLAADSPAFQHETLSKPGTYQFLPQQAGSVTVYATVEDADSASVDAALKQYAAYLEAKYDVSEEVLTSSLLTEEEETKYIIPRFRYQSEAVQRILYGTQNSLTAVSAPERLSGTSSDEAVYDPAVTALEQLQTLDNLEITELADGTLLAAYTTSQTAYFDKTGKTNAAMTEDTDRGIIKRLYLQTFDPEENAWDKNAILLKTLIDFDDCSNYETAGALKDGVYTDTSLTEPCNDPYFARLQFLKADLNGNGPEQLFLYEMNGNTYVVDSENLESAAYSGTLVVTPLFTEAQGKDAAIGSDNRGNLAVVYTAGVSGTENNALYVAWWDSELGKWGLPNILAMNHLQVLEDADKYGLSIEGKELAFYGKVTGNEEYDAYIASLTGKTREHAQGAMDRFTFSDLQMTLNGVGKDATLLVFGQGSMFHLKDSSFVADGEKVDTVINSDHVDVGFYGISFGAGEQGIGQCTLDLTDASFSTGSLLQGTVSFRNTGTVGLRGSLTEPMHISLTAGSETIATWILTENIPCGGAAVLDFVHELQSTIPENTWFTLAVAEDEYADSPFSCSMNLMQLTPKPDVMLTDISVDLGTIKDDAAELTVDYTVSNGGTGKASGVKLAFGYTDGKGNRQTVKTLDLGQMDSGATAKSAKPLTLTMPCAAFLEKEDLSGLSFFAEIGCSEEEYTASNNSYTTVISHKTIFGAPANISMALGNTLYLPVTFASTSPNSRIAAREIDAGTAGWEPRLGILYYDKNSGCIVAAPSETGGGIIHLEDQATNSIYAIGFTVTELGTGINIYRDNEAFIFHEADGALTDTEASGEDWSFPDEELKWDGNPDNAYEAPMNNDLSVAETAGAFVTFDTVADSITLYFTGSVTITSGSFETTVTSGSDVISPVKVSFGNGEGLTHTVTIKANTAGTQLDRYLEEYADGVDPTPVKDDGSPNFYWSRIFPDTASLEPGEQVTITCYVADDAALLSVEWNGAEPKNLIKVSDTLWKFDVTFTANVPQSGLVKDKAGNASECSVNVDWFNTVVSYGAIATAPAAPVLSFQKDDGSAIDSGKIKYYPWLLNSTAIPEGAAAAAYYSDAGVFTMNGALGAADDGRWQATANGIYLVRITAADGTWSQALIPMDQIDTDAPLVGVSSTDTALQISVTDSDLESVTVNGYALTLTDGGYNGRFPIDYGGSYTITARDGANNETTQTITVDLPVIAAEAVQVTAEVDENGGSVTVSVDPNKLGGGDFDEGASKPEENTYGAVYETALIPVESEDETPDASDAAWTDSMRAKITESGMYVLAVRGGSQVSFSAPITVTVEGETTDPTCEEEGSAVYTVTAEYEGEVSEKSAAVTIPARGHDWGEATYAWAEDGSSATAKRICARDETHVETETAKVTAQVTKEATCEEPGETTYTVSFANTAFEKQTKTAADIPATGHAWGEPKWSWTEDNKAGATFTCANDSGHVKTVEAAVEEDRKEPTCTEDGSVTCTATATFEGKAYTDTASRTLPATGHTWGEATYTWAEDNSAVTAKRVCAADETHIETETAKTTGKVTKEAACEEPGETTYTVSFENAAFEKQTKTAADIPAAGHAWGEPKWSWTEDNKAGATFTCTKDSGHVKTVEAAVEADSQEAACTEGGTVTYTAKVTFEGKEYTDTRVRTITAAGHVSGEPVHENEIPATCEQEGSYDEVVYCTVCKAELSRVEKTVPATGHVWGDWTTVKEPTAAASGVEQRFCEICGAKQTREKAFGGHVCSSEHFKDVDLDLWYHEDLDYVVENGLMIGISDDEFGPNLQMTRAMVVTALYRLEGEPAPKSKDRPFGDVASGSWYDAAVSWAAENGIVKGMSAEEFKPNESITREQMATIFHRYAKYKGFDVSANDALEKFADAGEVSGWALEAMQWCVGAGLINGMSGTELSPRGTATRIQYAAILHRFCVNVRR